MTQRIRVLIVDDHAVVRRGLRAFLDLQPDVEVVGEAADGASAEGMTGTLRPDVVLMDLVMPNTDGIATIRRLRAASEKPTVLVLTSFLDDVHVFAALQAGAAGYLLKDIQPDELVRAIRQVHQGESALHPKVAARLVQHTAQPAGFADFTPRERDVLRLLAEGKDREDPREQHPAEAGGCRSYPGGIARRPSRTRLISPSPETSSFPRSLVGQGDGRDFPPPLAGEGRVGASV